MVYKNTIMEGTVKFRDGKKWKPRWCVMRKLSPVADCLHLQLYRDCRDHYRQGQTKASLSLQHFLALETGFTLDKESNTMAIVCQDITVVLAFDSRELLIQWQVKIATNLGEDQQILVQVAAAPARSKISPGPAHLHIREHRFCLTSGVPPRLHGFWEINHLRKFGVVEGKFCFEGGSQCGKGEGLHVLMTDQGEDIAQALHLAGQGKPVSRKRSVARNVSVMESSPRRANQWRAEPRLSETQALHQSCAELSLGGFSLHQLQASTCSSSLNLPWPSSETSRPDSSDFGDACSSFAEQVHSIHQEWNDEKLEVCHCPTAYSSPAKSLSSCSTICATKGCSNQHSKNAHQLSRCDSPSAVSRKTENDAYQVPSRTIHCLSPKKASEKKCQIPPLVNSCICHSPKKYGLQAVSTGGDFQPSCNYDTPKSTLYPIEKDTSAPMGELRESLSLPPDENYDKPRNLIENEFLPEATSLQYSNYDVPPSSLQFPAMAPHCTKVVMEREDCQMLVCPCNRVFNWLSLPYCRRGYGMDGSTAQMCKVQLIKNEIMGATLPCRFQPTRAVQENSQATDITNVHPVPIQTIDFKDIEEEINAIDNENEKGLTTQSIQETAKHAQTNYANLEFADSLMLYENSRDVINRAASSANDDKPPDLTAASGTHAKIKSPVDDTSSRSQSCCKCGHSCMDMDQKDEPIKSKINSQLQKQDDYTLMDPDDFKEAGQTTSNITNKNNPWTTENQGFQEYLHMSPLTNQSSSRIVESDSSSQKRQIRSESISHFPGAFIRQKSLEMSKVPGRPVHCVDQSSISAASSPYLRRHFRFFKDDLPHPYSQFDRKRSNSVDYSNVLDHVNPHNSIREVTNGSVTLNSGRLQKVTFEANPEKMSGPPIAVFDNDIVKAEKNDKDDCFAKSRSLQCDKPTVHQLIEGSPVPVRRSCSVPCKSGHNRDSSSSNDSGVSAGSPKRQEFEVSTCPEKITNNNSSLLLNNSLHNSSCIHASLPRKSKSIDPLQELTFQFQITKRSMKSSDETQVSQENKESCKGTGSPNTAILGIDSQSTSSATSDMSDYIETLSLSSYSSSDTPDGLRLSRTAVITLKPRSGKEYHKVDRCYIMEEETKRMNNRVSTTIPEKTESPSPGYASGSPGN